ncbi:MAG TPA: RagB/SusD family nutrient uptake outer membrane protein [Chitinophagaceae bacterium]|jgi:starch-binding outer membrane protein, SusD/RagB family|nr:RagB/SusD family nutrient uptake outer membrane protein [Chitinophagaceae bacterium]
MKNKISKLFLALAVVFVFFACKKSFLEVSPNGVLDEATLSSEKGINKLLLAAYAMLDGHDGGLNLGGEWGSGGSNFLYGGIGGGEANKGSDPGDQGPNMTPVQRHDITATNGATNDRWKAIYEGVKRTNTVLELLAKVPSVSDASRKDISGQARALRAWYHFQARIIFGKACYLNEQIDLDLAAGTIPSVTNQTDIFPKIVEDAKYAWDNLPATQNAVGRINKWVAGAIYGKILLFTKDFATAKTVLNDVVANGANPLGVKFDLLANYDDNFNLAFDNSKESVLAFQASSLDNASARNGNWGDLLNTPSATGGGGAGFYCPTQYFVNQFKTTAAGLPAASPQNNQLMDPFGEPGATRYTGNVDVRLDWTVGRDQVPFHDWGTYLTTWPRDKSAGPYAGKKTMIRQSQVASTHDASIWFVGGGTALNLNLIRFSDVILMAAEAEIEAGSLANAFTLINRVRTRAQNSRKVVFDPTISGTPNTAPYTVAFATQAEARTALRLERALELGMEGWRFFDLVRWGIAATELNAYYNYESPMAYQVILKPKPTFTSPAMDYYPVPQQQIDLSHGFIKP